MDIPYAILTGGLEYEDGTSIIRVPIIRGYPKLGHRENVPFNIDDTPALFSYTVLDPRPPHLRTSSPRRSIGGITKQYLKAGQSAKNRLFGVPLNNRWDDRVSLIPQKGEFSRAKIILMIIGAILIIFGTTLSSVPLVEYLTLKNLKLLNGTLTHQYWQRPGILRLTKVYIFNVTNPRGILENKEKPILKEIGPFVYSEDMEKVNVQFHDNGTVTYQHKKILQFRPELSISENTKVVLPNIPVLTAASLSNSLALTSLVQMGLNMGLKYLFRNNQPFTTMTAKSLLFGYNDPIIFAAYLTFPRHMRPKPLMGLLLGRNGTLDEVSTINTGRDDMSKFGLIERLNGQDRLPMWDGPPCNSISASEGSLFPPRSMTGSDTVTLYDKDLCRVIPLRRRYSENHEGIPVDHFTPEDDTFDSNAEQNKCFCTETKEGLQCPQKGLQDISPCQFGAPLYLSKPHFLDSDPSLLDAVEGLKPDPEKHQTFMKINPKLGVPLQGQVRVQANFKPKRAPFIPLTRNFPEIAFPIMWVQEGTEGVTPPIRRWIYLANVADLLVDITAYGSITIGFCLLVGISTYTYRKQVFTKETIEKVPRAIRRGSSFIVNGQHRLLIIRDSYTRLNTNPDPDLDPDHDHDRDSP